MLRRTIAPAIVLPSLATAHRHIRQSTMRETMTPVPGHHAGMQNVMNEVAINPDHDEERKRPVFRSEVYPKHSEHSYLATMYKWGYNSLTLFLKVNEDPGPWWNANSSTLSSNWSQIGDFAICGLWTGIWRYTYGQGMYNLRPGELHKLAFGRRDKNHALVCDYQEKNAAPAQRYLLPHTKEHEVHKRYKNPPLKDTREMDAVFGKRVLRECQYHLGNALRFYLVDGYFGTNPKTSTPFRIITDNASHGYLGSICAVRQHNITCAQELVLAKRVNHAPLDEWTWRRPPVVVFHCPGFDFEAPRIVEEFGGPRPQDLGLTAGNKFSVLDAYSIPMRCMMGADPNAGSLLGNIALLAARWGYYADNNEHLTLLHSDSVMSAGADGNLTVLVHDGSVDTDAIRRSPLHWGAMHHRVAEGTVARCWDATRIAHNKGKTQTHNLDYVEPSTDSVWRPLPTKVGVDPKVCEPGNAAVSQRHRCKRNIHNYGYKWKHAHLKDATAKAASAGMLFKTKAQGFSRPSIFGTTSTNFVFATSTVDAAKQITAEEAAKITVDQLAAAGSLYAEPEKLVSSFTKAYGAAASLTAVPAKGNAVETLAAKGHL